MMDTASMKKLVGEVKSSQEEDKKMKARADKVRSNLSTLSDTDLVYFSDSIYFSTFKSVTEHIKDVANEYNPKMPF